MGQIPPEPIRSQGVRHPQGAHNRAQHNARPSQPQPANIDALIATVQQEFPNSFRVTGRGRTVYRQAELMAQTQAPK